MVIVPSLSLWKVFALAEVSSDNKEANAAVRCVLVYSAIFVVLHAGLITC